MTAAQSEVGPPTPPEEGEAPERGKLLVVDDDRTIRGLVGHAMGLRGYEVLEAENAEDGEELLNGGGIPVALVDINLPGMSGIDLVRRFAGNTAVAIILFTGDNAGYTYDQAIHEGAADFLLKPVRLAELALRIERALDSRRLRMAQEKLVGELERLAVTDDLTGLANRRQLLDRLAEEVSRARRYGRPLSLLMIDIDHFKQLNDRFGHAAGDVVLKALGNRMRADVRATDWTFRYGGEEFVILLPENRRREAEALAERLRQEIAGLRLAQCPQCKVTVSIGVAEYICGESPALFRDRADAAMYAAKRAGRNRVVCAPSGQVGGAEADKTAGASVLVIDADPAIRRMVAATLTHHGHTVHTATTVADGFRVATEEVADVVFIDPGIPEDGAVGVMRELRDRHDLGRVVIITAHPAALDTPEFHELGPITLLEKPLVEEEVVACLEAAGRAG